MGAKAMDGVKTLDVQHPGTRRRMEGGTVVQLITEQERSVSAPALWPQVADLRCSVAAKPISGDPVKWWSVERKSEEGIVAVIDVDNTTRRSEGPPARCARPTGEGCEGLPSTAIRPRLCSPENRVRVLGLVANTGGFVECGGPTAWGKAG